MKPFWRIDRVNQITPANIAGYIDLLSQEDGKPYLSLYQSADVFYSKPIGTDHFGRIITNINMLGLIIKNGNGTFNLSETGKFLKSKPSLLPAFLDFFLTRLQFPRPHIDAARTNTISKPMVLILSVLIGLYEIGGSDEAYLTEQEFHDLFGNKITDISQINNALINMILAGNRAWGKSISSQNNSADLNYDKALFANSKILTTTSSDYPSAIQKFFIGLKRDDGTYQKANFIKSHFGNISFEFNRSISSSDKDLNNDWSTYISNKNGFLNYITITSMITHIKPFTNYVLEKGFYFDDSLIRRFVLSLISKKYLILTGISGSGKSKIAELFGYYLKESNSGDILIKAIGSNWNDSKPLLGFINPLAAAGTNFNLTDVVNYIQTANGDLSKIYVILLDEMNLSYTERYFSEFLSALESLKKEIVLADGSKIIWSDNIKIIGTINEDETTHTLSPKVIDRANVIEMNGSLPSDYFNMLNSKGDSRVTKLFGKNWHTKYLDILDDLFKATNGGFGYRVMNEITEYVELNFDLDSSKNFESYLDEQIYQKILPKIHGARAEVKGKLDGLENICTNNNMPLALLKVGKMKTQLQNTGFTSFVNS